MVFPQVGRNKARPANPPKLYTLKEFRHGR